MKYTESELGNRHTQLCLDTISKVLGVQVFTASRQLTTSSTQRLSNGNALMH